MKLKIQVKKNVPQKMDASDNPTYEEWVARVDRLISRYTFVSLHDLPDVPLRDWYDARLRPIRAANRALKCAQE